MMCLVALLSDEINFRRMHRVLPLLNDAPITPIVSGRLRRSMHDASRFSTRNIRQHFVGS
jgi:hypothetical protein